MAAELVNAATSEKLTEVDWTKSIEICEFVAHDQRQAKDVIKAIKRRLGSKNSNTQMFTLMLLEMLMNNIGDHVHRQVIDTGLLPMLVKIVKKKSDSPAREKIFLLLDATQTSLGGNSGRFPQYYSAYYDLVSAGVKFPQRAHAIPPNHQPNSVANTDVPPAVEQPSATSRQRSPAEVEPHTIPESSIIQKAGSSLEVLREVLDAVDSQHPEGAKEEFTLDLVEQCSFQKQRVMHLVLTSRDEKVVSQAIDLNDQLEKVLDRHDQLISGKATSKSNHFVHDKLEEEDEQLFRRIRKGKGHAQAEDEDREKPMHRPITRDSPSQQRPLVIGPPLKSAGVKFPQRAQAIPPNHQPTSVVNTYAPPAGEQPPSTLRQRSPTEVEPHTVPESSIIQKAASALEVLREVLDAVDSQHPEGAKEEFTLDLVEQCSFQKQRVMHLVLTSRDETVVSQAVDLNDQLEKVLNRHDQLISGRTTSTSNHFVHDEVEVEEEQLFRRIRKGKGHARAEDEDREKLIHRPITREQPGQQRPLVIGPPLKVGPLQPPQANGSGAGSGVAIPPPPAKYVEREKFFQENIIKSDSTGLATHVRGLSLHSRRSSGNSYSLSTDSD